MTDIFELNKSVFGTKFKSKAPSRRVRRAMVQEHIVPDCAVGIAATLVGFLMISMEIVTSITGLINTGFDIFNTIKFGGFSEKNHQFIFMKWSEMSRI